MAKQTIVELIDDISGERITDGSGRSVSFAFDGAQYEIDLTDTHVEEFRSALEQYISASRRVAATSRGTSRASVSRARRNDVQAIREWAAANGYEVATRGRISQTVLEAYEAR